MDKHGDVKLRTKLYKQLTQDYERNVNPDNPNVQFGVSLIDVDIVSFILFLKIIY